MTEILTPARAGHPTVDPVARAGLTRGQELLSVGFGAWLVVGLFIDGWAHNHHRPETIFTPWHAILYSGFLACGAYSLWIVQRKATAGRVRDTLPVGQGLVLVGVAIFAMGAVGDLVWHSVFGIEANVAALLSPTHLVMFAGATLLLTGPFRSAWADGRMQAPSLGELAPALISLTLVSALVAFFFMYLSPFRRDSYGTGLAGAAHGYAEAIEIEGVASVLMTGVLYLTPLLLALRRWRLPFGAATVLFTGMTVLIGGIDAFDRWPTLLAGPMAGLAADLLLRRLDPSAARPWALRAFATAVPVVLWLSFFALYELAYGVGWEPELWAGVTVMAGLSGAGLSLLVTPPAVPVAVAARQ